MEMDKINELRAMYEKALKGEWNADQPALFDGHASISVVNRDKNPSGSHYAIAHFVNSMDTEKGQRNVAATLEYILALLNAAPALMHQAAASHALATQIPLNVKKAVEHASKHQRIDTGSVVFVASGNVWSLEQSGNGLQIACGMGNDMVINVKLDTSKLQEVE